MTCTRVLPVRRSASRRIVLARRAGLSIDIPEPHLPVVEQEQADTM
ncbi:MAG: hypothetical protein ACREHG_06070 [Candidatus Saccharimonadales bacterium]